MKLIGLVYYLWRQVREDRQSIYELKGEIRDMKSFIMANFEGEDRGTKKKVRKSRAKRIGQETGW